MLPIRAAVLYTALLFGANPAAADIAAADALRAGDMQKLSFSEPQALPEIGLLGMDDAPRSLTEFRGKWVLVNFWATWCPPCIKELPLLDAFYARQRVRGWQVLGLAIDQPGNVQAFLQRSPVQFPMALAGAGGAEVSRSLGNERGGLPFTVLFAADGSILQRKMGQLSERDLSDWAQLA